jgi:hypothetical protein
LARKNREQSGHGKKRGSWRVSEWRRRENTNDLLKEKITKVFQASLAGLENRRGPAGLVDSAEDYLSVSEGPAGLRAAANLRPETLRVLNLTSVLA